MSLSYAINVLGPCPAVPVPLCGVSVRIREPPGRRGLCRHRTSPWLVSPITVAVGRGALTRRGRSPQPRRSAGHPVARREEARDDSNGQDAPAHRRDDRTRSSGLDSVAGRSARRRQSSSTTALAREISRATPTKWATSFGNSQHSPDRPASAPGGPSKAAAVLEAAQALEAEGVLTADDITDENGARVKRALRSVAGGRRSAGCFGGRPRSRNLVLRERTFGNSRLTAVGPPPASGRGRSSPEFEPCTFRPEHLERCHALHPDPDAGVGDLELLGGRRGNLVADHDVTVGVSL